MSTGRDYYLEQRQSSLTNLSQVFNTTFTSWFVSLQSDSDDTSPH